MKMKTQKEISKMIDSLKEDLNVPKLSKKTNGKITAQIKSLEWVIKEG
jgi:hypothetical protein